MSIVYLYHTEDSEKGGTLSAAGAGTVSMLDQFLKMFGGVRACVHPVEAEYKPTASTSYDTLADAQAAYLDHEWVYLDPTATDTLADFVHPVGNTVYVVGHDEYGYGDLVLKGTRLKIMDVVGFAIPCLIAAVCDRWSKSWQ